MQREFRDLLKASSNLIADYLFGARTIYKYKNEASLYREFQQNPYITKNYNRYSRKGELRFLMYGRVIPMFADAFLLGAFISSRDFTALCGMILTAGYRHAATGFAEKSIENLADARKMLQDSWDKSQKGSQETVLGYLSREYEIEENDECD